MAREPKKYIVDENGNKILNPAWIKWNGANIGTKLQKDYREEGDLGILPDEPQEKTSQEKRDIASKLDYGGEASRGENKTYTIDRFGNVTQNPPRRSPEQLAQVGAAEVEAQKAAAGLPTNEQIVVERQQRAEAQQLAGKVGQFEQLPVEATELDYWRLSSQAITDATPNALKWAGGALAGGATIGAGIGLAGGPAAPVTVPAGTGAGAAIGGTVGIIGGALILGGSISSSLKSSYNDQRRDMKEKPQVTLTDGKTSLSDWATLAGSDPSRRAEAVEGFNKQLALIDQAHRQVKLDTDRDILEFESAADLLADFEVFYSDGGERDIAIADMRQALLADGNDPVYIYRMALLADKRVPT